VLRVALDRPQEQRIAGKELVAPALRIAIPQLFTGLHAHQGAAHQTGEHQGKAVIEPDDGVGTAPHQVADLAVVAIGHPAVAR